MPKQLRVHWEAQRPHVEARLRQEDALPAEAVTMAVSLDGVLAPRQDGQRQAKRTHARATGQAPRGPAGYQEVGCATGAYSDGHGARLCTRRMARRPEPTTATRKSQLTAAVRGALRQRPDLRVMQVADGAPANWSSVGETLPFGEEGLDFSHAAEHRGAALGAAYGEGTPTYQERVETVSEVLRDAPEGVNTVMGALDRLRTRCPRRQAIHKALAYFREHRHRMR